MRRTFEEYRFEPKMLGLGLDLQRLILSQADAMRMRTRETRKTVELNVLIFGHSMIIAVINPFRVPVSS